MISNTAADFGFDTDVMRKTARVYREEAATLNELDTTLTGLLEVLNTEWTSKAGRAFKEMMVMDWSEALKLYTEFIVSFADILDSVAGAYESLVNDKIERMELG